jgi:hypothetical protein
MQLEGGSDQGGSVNEQGSGNEQEGSLNRGVGSNKQEAVQTNEQTEGWQPKKKLSLGSREDGGKAGAYSNPQS